MHPHNDDEEIILKDTIDFQVAWNNADEKGLASYFTDDCIRVGSFGEIQRGKAEIEAAYKQLRKKELPDSKILHQRGEVRFLSDDIATWQSPYELFSPGASTLKGYTLTILKKIDGVWKINEMHVRIFPVS